jgi:hypothetical protein
MKTTHLILSMLVGFVLLVSACCPERLHCSHRLQALLPQNRLRQSLLSFP